MPTLTDIIILLIVFGFCSFLLWMFGIYFPNLHKKEEEANDREATKEYPTDFLQDINDSEKPYFSKDYDDEVFPHAFKKKL